METGSVLAEALVKVKLVYDGNDIKQQATTAAEMQGKALKTQIGNLRKQARAFSQIASGLNKAASVLFKTIVAPALLLGGLGVKKYMQSNEKGAAQLRTGVKGLTKSWDQFLGRVGRVIYNSGILTKVIDKLKKILDGLDDKKIGQLLNVAKWAAILWVMIKITAQIATWPGIISKVVGAVKTLGLMGWGGAVAGAGAGAAKAGVKQIAGKEVAVAAGAGAAGGGGLIATLKALPASLNSFMNFWKRYDAQLKESGGIRANFAGGPRKIGPSSLTVASSMYKAGKSLEKGPFLAQGSFGALSKVLFALGRFSLALEFVFKRILLPLEFLAGYLRGVGVNVKGAGDLLLGGLGYLWKVIKTISVALDFLMSAFRAGAEAIGAIMKSEVIAIFAFWKKALIDGLESALFDLPNIYGNLIKNIEKGLMGIYDTEKRGEGVGEKMANIWTPLTPRGERKMQFIDKQPPKAVSFAGLQQAAQEMITGDNTTATKDNTTAIKENTAALVSKRGEKGNAFLGVMNNMIDTSAFQASQLPYGVTAVSRGMAY